MAENSNASFGQKPGVSAEAALHANRDDDWRTGWKTIASAWAADARRSHYRFSKAFASASLTVAVDGSNASAGTDVDCSSGGDASLGVAPAFVGGESGDCINDSVVAVPWELSVRICCARRKASAA